MLGRKIERLRGDKEGVDGCVGLFSFSVEPFKKVEGIWRWIWPAVGMVRAILIPAVLALLSSTAWGQLISILFIEISYFCYIILANVKISRIEHLFDCGNQGVCVLYVSIKLFSTDSPDVLEVAGRGELQLAVLIEAMRREGYELQVSRPEVITKEVNGKRYEPQERGVCDVPDEHVGTVTQELAPRKGRVTDLRPGDPGRTIVTFECPSRGLIGFRSLLMTATRGTALLHQHHLGWMPWAGDMPDNRGGAMVADRIGLTTGYALDKLQLTGQFFVEPGTDVYEGMVVGECSRDDEMVVNVVRAKEKTNIRTHSHDDAVKLPAPKIHSLETAIEWIANDELVEVTPKHIRIRKRHLGLEDRRKANKKVKTG